MCIMCLCHCSATSIGISLPPCALVFYHFTAGHYSGSGPTECIQRIQKKSVEHNKKGYLLYRNATSFDPTVGSSSGELYKIENEST
jgi:hypothetical protein